MCILLELYSGKNFLSETTHPGKNTVNFRCFSHNTRKRYIGGLYILKCFMLSPYLVSLFFVVLLSLATSCYIFNVFFFNSFLFLWPSFSTQVLFETEAKPFTYCLTICTSSEISCHVTILVHVYKILNWHTKRSHSSWVDGYQCIVKLLSCEKKNGGSCCFIQKLLW